MLKKTIAAAIIGLSLSAGAQAQTIVLLPEPGSMEPATVIIDPKAGRNAPVLVCASLSQVTTGGCLLRNWTQTGLRRH
jgi:hypothetical protein